MKFKILMKVVAKTILCLITVLFMVCIFSVIVGMVAIFFANLFHTTPKFIIYGLLAIALIVIVILRIIEIYQEEVKEIQYNDNKEDDIG